MRNELGLKPGKQIRHVERREGSGAVTAAHRQHEMTECADPGKSLPKAGKLRRIEHEAAPLALQRCRRRGKLFAVAACNGDRVTLFQK